MDFCSIVKTLNEFWGEYGCTILFQHETEVGAGTLSPATALHVLGSKSLKIAYLQPSVRPSDGRYGLNPNRLYQHHQYQVIIKPSACDLQQKYISSIEKLGIKRDMHDIRFSEDDWANPSIGACGLGWEVSCDGMEISQFTYMQQMGGINCELIAGEITYGLERLAMYIQNVDNIYDLEWDRSGRTYGSIYRIREAELSKTALDCCEPEILHRHFSDAEYMCNVLLGDTSPQNALPYAAYEQCLKASHILNLLDAGGVLGVHERTNYIDRVRKMASRCCKFYISKYDGANI